MIPPNTDSMKHYMQEIAQTPLITLDEEVSLGATVQAGIRATKCRDNTPELEPTTKLHLANLARQGEEAQQTLIKANLRLVISIAQKFKGLGLSLQDLISEGNLGLMVAAKKFDPIKGATFGSYAAWWIKQSIRKALSNQARTIRIPVTSASKVHKIRKAKEKLATKLGRAATDQEIADHLNLSLATIRRLNKAATDFCLSLDDPLNTSTDAGLLRDIIPDTKVENPEQATLDSDSSSALAKHWLKLTPQEQNILTLRYGLYGNKPQTLQEIADTINRTRERVRQVQVQALTKLREWMNADLAIDNDKHSIHEQCNDERASLYAKQLKVDESFNLNLHKIQEATNTCINKNSIINILTALLRQGKLKEALDALPNDQKVVLIRRYGIDGKPALRYIQMAAKLHGTSSTKLSDLGSRALQAISSKLNPVYTLNLEPIIIELLRHDMLEQAITALPQDLQTCARLSSNYRDGKPISIANIAKELDTSANAVYKMRDKIFDLLSGYFLDNVTNNAQ